MEKATPKRVSIAVAGAGAKYQDDSDNDSDTNSRNSSNNPSIRASVSRCSITTTHTGISSEVPIPPTPVSMSGIDQMLGALLTMIKSIGQLSGTVKVHKRHSKALSDTVSGLNPFLEEMQCRRLNSSDTGVMNTLNELRLLLKDIRSFMDKFVDKGGVVGLMKKVLTKGEVENEFATYQQKIKDTILLLSNLSPGSPPGGGATNSSTGKPPITPSSKKRPSLFSRLVSGASSQELLPTTPSTASPSSASPSSSVLTSSSLSLSLPETPSAATSAGKLPSSAGSASPASTGSGGDKRNSKRMTIRWGNTSPSPDADIQSLYVRESSHDNKAAHDAVVDDDEAFLVKEGRFAVTNRMRRRDNHDPVAVKMIHVERLRGCYGTADIHKVKVEASKLLLDLNHKNIIKYYHVYFAHHEKYLNIAMEFVEGAQSLAERIQFNRCSVVECMHVLRQMNEALKYLHFTQRIQHRDLRPENVIVLSTAPPASRVEESTIQVKLIDIAIPSLVDANFARSLKTERSGMKQAYSSYEKANALPYDGRDDMWAMGIILTELLIGRRIYNNTNDSDDDSDDEGLLTDVNSVKRRKRLIASVSARNPVLGDLMGTLLVPSQDDRPTSLMFSTELAAVEHELAEIYEFDHNDMATAMKYYTMAADKGYPESLYILGMKLLKQHKQEHAGAVSTAADFVALLQRAAEGGHMLAAHELAKHFATIDNALGRSNRTHSTTSSNSQTESVCNSVDMSNRGSKRGSSSGGSPIINKSNDIDAAAAAVKYYRVAASAGHAQSQFELGCLHSGDSAGSVLAVSINPHMAISYFQQAAAQGHFGATLRLAQCYIDGAGCEQDKVHGFKLLFPIASHPVAADADNDGDDNKHAAPSNKQIAEAQYKLAKLYASSSISSTTGVVGEQQPAVELPASDETSVSGTESSQQEVVISRDERYHHWLSLAAENGSSEAQYELGRELVFAEDVDNQKKAEGLRLLGVAADEGNNVAAQFTLGYCCAKGLIVPSPSQQDSAQQQGIEYQLVEMDAIRYYRLAAEAGHAEAQYNLAICYVTGNMLGPSGIDIAEGFRLITLAAEAPQSLAEAQCTLADWYSTGKYAPVVGADHAKAFEFYRLAAAQKHQRALFCMGYHYSKQMKTKITQSSTSHVDKQDAEKKMVEYYTAAADLGDSSAQCNLGNYYWTQTKKSDSRYSKKECYALAFKYYQLAAAQGNGVAQYKLGNIYATGKGTPDGAIDFDKAFECYYLAASHTTAHASNASALLQVGLFYGDGIGVQVNHIQSVRYLTRAATLGNTLASVHLGKKYLAGQGSDPDVDGAVRIFKQVIAGHHASGSASNSSSAGSSASNKNAYSFAAYELAQLSLAYCYMHGKGVEKNEKQAFELYVQLIQGAATAAAAHSTTAVSAKSETDDDINTKADANVLNEALYHAGMCCLEGTGVNRDTARGIQYLSQAATKNHVQACYQCGLYYYQQGNTRVHSSVVNTVQLATACKYFRQAAELGHAISQYKLGCCYLRGIHAESGNTTLDRNQANSAAAKCFVVAAAQNYAPAQYKLAECYVAGIIEAEQSNSENTNVNKSVSSDEASQARAVEAVRLYQLSAAQGYAKAQYKLGRCYEHGVEGVLRVNISKAVEYYTEAATQELPDALFVLGLRYHSQGKDQTHSLLGLRKSKASDGLAPTEQDGLKLLIRAAELKHQPAIDYLASINMSVAVGRTGRNSSVGARYASMSSSISVQRRLSDTSKDWRFAKLV
jgi:TPR repeat protein